MRGKKKSFSHGLFHHQNCSVQSAVRFYGEGDADGEWSVTLPSLMPSTSVLSPDTAGGDCAA